MPRWLPLAGLVLLVSCKPDTPRVVETPPVKPLVEPVQEPKTEEPPPTSIKGMVASEDMILSMSPLLGRLDRSVLNLRLPDPGAQPLFAGNMFVRDLAGENPASETKGPLRKRTWLIGEEQTAARAGLELWQPLFAGISWFENAHFYLIRGRFLDAKHERWEGELGFSGLARAASGHWWGIRSRQTVVWEPGADGRPRLTAWRLTNLETVESDRRLFVEVLDEALGDPALLTRARRSIHEETLLGLLQGRLHPKAAPKHLQFVSFDRHPGVTVVDIDRDGFDDLYVMARWGKNLLLRNRGNGTFEEIAGRIGLDIDSYTSCAIFADFDNDGDPDAFLGRTLRRSIYLENENGTFVDRSAEQDGFRLPYFVSAISAADYDGDGLTDLYISTYSARHMQRVLGDAVAGKPLMPEHLPLEDATELTRLYREQEAHIYLNFPGPPNLLLKNDGGSFKPAGKAAGIRLFRNTYQSTWGDYDDDGDPDLYCANDFSPNNLFRNEGNGTFSDVTAETGTSDIGFGMGASWGDYDNDGRLDLYVTNMFSKAGRRITSQIEGLDPRIAQMARGNSLFRNLGDRFEKVSGLKEGSQQVEAAQWSWGSQFVDVDNDGRLDIYALSGNFTAPPQASIPVDT